VEFSRLPGGQNCLKNLFLIKHGIFPSELQMYNEFRNGGASREVTIGLIRANRQPA